MIYDSYTKTDDYYEFIKGEEHLILPASNIVLVDDESGMIAIKTIASRATIGLVRKTANNE